MRSIVAALLVAVLVAGCGGGGDTGPVQLSASAASIDGEALQSAGYEPVGEEAGWVNETVSVSISGDVELQASKDVRARSPLVTYRRPTDHGPAVVGLMAVPAVRLLEDSMNVPRNPAGDLGPAGFARRLPGPYSEIEVGEAVENTSVTMFGNETHLVTYAATATVDGSTVDVRISVATVRHEGDYVTFVAVHPSAVDERGRLQRLLDGVRH